MTSIRFLQISDLHLGEPHPQRGFAKWDANVLDWWALLPIFDGVLGHGYLALTYLEELYDELFAEGPLQLLVTGDCTRVGATAEFAVVDKYLGGTLTIEPGNAPGLGHTTWKRTAIPGNHDHWPGISPAIGANALTCMLGGSGLPANSLRPCPWTLNFTFGRYRLAICGINSDADVSPKSRQRVFARGDFASQCHAALAHFQRHSQPKPRDEIRCLLVHHSYLHTGYILGIRNQSRTELQQLIDGAEIDVVFTGHEHSAACPPPHGYAPNRRWHERRCGTTTQISAFPKRFPWNVARAQQAMKLRKLPSNTALLHTFTDTGVGATLVTTVYQRRKSAGPFEKVDTTTPVAL